MDMQHVSPLAVLTTTSAYSWLTDGTRSDQTSQAPSTQEPNYTKTNKPQYEIIKTSQKSSDSSQSLSDEEQKQIDELADINYKYLAKKKD